MRVTGQCPTSQAMMTNAPSEPAMVRYSSGSAAAAVSGSTRGSPAATLTTAAITAPIAQPTALAAIGLCRGPRLNSTVPRLAAVAATKIASRPTGATWLPKLPENMTATPAKATTAPITLNGVSVSMPRARVNRTLDSGMVAYRTADRPDGTLVSPQYSSGKLIPN